jgi:signal transduction histidine kinase/ActR/RegA family two-component response regulator
MEYRVILRGGGVRWLYDRGKMERDSAGQPMYLMGACTDITKRKQVEQALRDTAERLRLLWEAATVLLTTEDPDAMLRSLFAKIAPHFGLDAYFNFLVNEAGDGLRMGSCAGIPEEEARRITRLEFGQAVCGTVALRRKPIIATYIQQSDEAMVQLVKGYGIRTYACNPLLVEGRLLGTLSFASRTRDDFEPDELEFLRTICHYVTVAYERVRLMQQLRDQDRRKDEFLATLAHELRNPLAPIRNSLQILKMPRVDAALIERSRAMMERQVHHLVRLVDDLLDVSRVMRGKITLRKERMELASVIARAIETVQPLIDAQGHELTVSLSNESLLLEADPVRLAQVIGNLLTNAAKYTEPRGKIFLTARRERDYAVLKVRDTGIGIAPEMLPKIFDLFVQVDHAATKSQGGLGIGLTLVRNLVEMHQGRVGARSAGLGQGSEFVVHLPLAEQQVEEPTQPIERTQPKRNGYLSRRRIVIVDDNVDAAESLATLLRLQGHEVRVAHDGPSGLQMIQPGRQELVFLDIGMPGMDGNEVARRLRQQPALNGLVLVALTGWGTPEDRRRTAVAGFDHHLVKPVEPAALDQLLAGLAVKNSPQTKVAGEHGS